MTTLDGATDVHVHLLPDRLMAAIRESLREEVGWTFHHPTDRAAIEDVLAAHGVERYCALPYAHRAGVAADLNDWVLARAAESEMCVPFATVHGEDDVRSVVRAAFEAGARGLKFQCPVQEAAPDDPRLDPAYELCAEYDRPVLFHAGTAPMFEDSPHVGVDHFRRFLDAHPEVRACAAHMGAYETPAFVETLADHGNAYLDLAYVLGDGAAADMAFASDPAPAEVLERHADRIMFGSDYPNVTFDYGDCVEGLLARDLPTSVRRDLVHRTAERFLYGE